MQCLSSLGQTSYSQINPTCQEKQPLVSFTSSLLQQESVWPVIFQKRKLRENQSHWHLLETEKQSNNNEKKHIKAQTFLKNFQLQMPTLSTSLDYIESLP